MCDSCICRKLRTTAIIRKEVTRMKRKRLLWFVLSLLMMLALAACGAEDDDDDSSDGKKEPTEKAAEATPTAPEDATPTGAEEVTPVVTEPVDKDPIATPTPDVDPKTVLVLPLDETLVAEDHVPATTYVEMVDCQNIKFNLYTTAICAPRDGVIPKLKEDVWLNKKGAVASYYREEGTRNPGLEAWRVSYADGVVIAGPEQKGSEGLDIFDNGYVWYECDATQFTNENRVVFSIGEVDIKSAEELENVERIVKMVFGEELGNLLFRAKESDAEKYAGAPNDFKAIIEKDGMKYLFSRVVFDLDKEKAHLAFSVSVEPKRLQYAFYDGGYEKQIANFGGLPNEVFEGNIGGDNILDFDTFADNLCDFKDQIGISLVFYKARRYISPDGRTRYDLSFEVNDEFKLEYTYGTVNGVTDDVSGLELKLKTKPFPKATEDAVVPDGLYDEINRSIEALIGYNPGITQDMLKKNSSFPLWWETIPLKFKVNGLEIEKRFRIEAYGDTKKENRGIINIY